MERLTERRWTKEDNTFPTIELEHCGNCGGSGEILLTSSKAQVKCKVCGMQTPWCGSQTQAIGIWNKRI